VSLGGLFRRAVGDIVRSVRRILLMTAGLILLTAAVYWPIHRFKFISYDDSAYTTDNPLVQRAFGPGNIRLAFTSFEMSNWQPLLWLSYFTDQALFQLRPGPMHVENVLLHVLTGILLWRFLCVLTGSVNRSFIVAALFLCHPMHVESVAWISERKDVLSLLLLLAAMVMYVRFCRNRTTPAGWIAYGGMLLFFALSLMVKSMGVTLPAVLLLMDFWPLKQWPGHSWLRLILEKIPVILLSMAASILAFLAQHKSGATATAAELGITYRIENAIVCYVIYMVKLVFPTNLAIYYPHPGDRPAAAVFAAAAVLGMITFFAWRVRRRFSYFIVGWLWFVVTLLPVIGIVQIGGQAMADRYSYFPSIGFFVLVVWGFGDLRWLPHRLQAAFAGVVIIALAAIAHKQVSYWQDSRTLFTHALNAGADSAIAHIALGQAAYKDGNIHQAVDEYRAALRFGPFSMANFGMGCCWARGHDYPQAIIYFSRAIDDDPASVPFRVAYAESLRLNGNLAEAAAQARIAMSLDPTNPGAQAELARINSK
jgi:tetratricopeptide (TPR) repeat protein